MIRYMTTPKGITFIVVGTLAVMSLIYVGTLAYCVIAGVPTTGEIIRSFEAAGIYVLGALTGILVNTRSQQHDENARPSTDPNLHSTCDSTTESTSRTITESHAIPKSKSDSTPQSDSATTTAKSP